MLFREDGTATWWCSNVPKNTIYAPYRLRWSAAENRLVWRYEYATATEAMYGEYERLRYRFWNQATAAPHESEFEIVEFSDRTIELDAIGKAKSRYRWFLRRTE